MASLSGTLLLRGWQGWYELEEHARHPWHPCQWRSHSYNVTSLGTLNDGVPLLLPTPPPRVKGITPPSDVITAPAVLPAGERGCHLEILIPCKSLELCVKIIKNRERRRVVEENEYETREVRGVWWRAAAQKHRSAQLLSAAVLKTAASSCTVNHTETGRGHFKIKALNLNGRTKPCCMSSFFWAIKQNKKNEWNRLVKPRVIKSKTLEMHNLLI